MNQSKTDRILARAKKMIALAQSTDYASEAATAMSMVEKLLAKYNLTMSEVESVGDKNDVSQLQVINRYGRPWSRVIYYNVCALYGCSYLYGTLRAGKCSHYFIGKPHNIEIAKQMSSYLVLAVKRLMRAEKKSWEANATNEEGILQFAPRKFNSSFCMGAAHNITDRIKQMIQDRQKQARKDAEEAASVSGTSLAVVMENELQKARDYVDNNIQTKRVRPRQSSINGGAYNIGRSSASSISINTQIQ